MADAMPRGWKKGVATLFSGSLLGSALALGVQPVLTRLFPADAFGTADLFAAVLMLVLPVASLRYEDALLLPEDDDDAAQLFWLAAALSLAVATLLAAFVWARPWVERSGYAALGPLLGWLAPGLAVLRAQALTEAWLTRLRRYGPLSSGQAVRGGATSAYRLGAAFVPGADGAAALSVGFVAGYAAAAAVQAAPLVHAPGALAAPANAGRMRALAHRYRRFALFATPAQLLHALAGRLPVLVLAATFAPSVVGLFGRVALVVATPLGIVGGALARVFISHAADARRDGTLAPLADAFHRQLVYAGLFPTLALCAFGPDVFAFVFGEPWREAGVYAQFTAPWLFLASVAASLTVLFDVTESQRLDLVTGVMMTTGLAGALWVGAQDGQARTAIALAGAAGALLRTGQLALLLGLADLPLRRAAIPYLGAAVASLPGLALGYAASLLGNAALTTAALAVGAAATYGLLFTYERRRHPEGTGAA